jgi:hypothetical protein
MKTDQCVRQLNLGYGGIGEVYMKNHIQGILFYGTNANSYKLTKFQDPELKKQKEE